MYKLQRDYSNGDLERKAAQSKEPAKISEELVLYYTDCRNLSEVQVVALRERNLYTGFEVLSKCTSL